MIYKVVVAGAGAEGNRDHVTSTNPGILQLKSIIVCKMGSEGFPQNLFGFGNSIHVHKVHVYEVYGHKVHAYEVHAYEVHARETTPLIWWALWPK